VVTKMTTLKAVDAKSHFSEILDRAARGEEFVVTRRGKPVARVLPYARMTQRDLGEFLGELRQFRQELGPVRRSGESWSELSREGLKW